MLVLAEVNRVGDSTVYRVKNQDIGVRSDYFEGFFLENFNQHNDGSVTIKLKRGQFYERLTCSDLFTVGTAYKVLSLIGESSAVVIDNNGEFNIISPTIHLNNWLLVC